MKDQRMTTLLSHNRSLLYREKFGEHWLEHYREEVDFAQSCYSGLHFLEIFLRNKINDELGLIYGKDWLLDECKVLNSKAICTIQATKQALIDKRKNVTQDDIISNLSFGFWTGLFHGFYHDKLWNVRHTLLLRIFPNLHKRDRSPKKIEHDLNQIRKFRNRIFHFETLIDINQAETKTLIEKYLNGIYGKF